MMGLEIRQLFRVECDHCGKANESRPSANEARTTAMSEGFRIADWLDNGCPRQTCFCAECVDQFIKDKIGETTPIIVKPERERFL